MNRKEFLKNCGLLGLGAWVLPSFLSSCNKEEDLVVNFSGDVLIIGAGAAGLHAGYKLQRYGINVQILEASGVMGGRVKKTDDFADFPIDLGAEWMHGDMQTLARLVDDTNVTGSVSLIPYSPEVIYYWNNEVLHKANYGSGFYADHKFKNTTWYDFLEQFIAPSIQDKIIYNAPVNAIDYSGNRVVATTTDGATYEADRVILTVPIAILKENYITFTPEFPAAKTAALEKVEMPDGIKVFIEFSEQFYPDILLMDGLFESESTEHIYYNAAFRKDSTRNIMGLFTVNGPSTQYAALDTDAEIIAKVLETLDMMFEGKASQTYMNHVTQNWSKEPFIKGSYSHYQTDDWEEVTRTLAENIEGKIYFAGEAYSIDNGSTVHGAGFSGFEAAEAILKG